MRRWRVFAGAATAAVAAVTLATSSAPALGSARDLSAVSGVIAPKTVNKTPVVRVNQVGYPSSGPKAAFAMLPRNVAVVRFEGDYNFWFLPQQEDRMNVSPGGNPGPSAYYVKYRPVFPAAPPGQKVSPNLAGRFAADFALGAQVKGDGEVGGGSDPAQAQHLLSLAR